MVNNQVISIQPEISKFLELLVVDCSMEVADEKVKKLLIEELYENLNTYISRIIFEHLSSEDGKKLTQLNQAGSDTVTVDAFIKSHLPDSQKIYTKAFLDFRALFLSEAAVQHN